MARQNEQEAEERIRQRERELLDEMRAEMQEEGLLEVRLQEAREESARLLAANEVFVCVCVFFFGGYGTW